MPQLMNVVITGTSSGMGKSAALYLADRGYRVFGGNLPGEEGATGSNISSAPLDIRSDEMEIEAGEIRGRFVGPGSIDGAIRFLSKE